MVEFIKMYPSVFEESGDGVSVFFPDMPGCVSAGSDYEDAYNNAAEALTLHISGMIEDGETAPQIDMEKAKAESKRYGALVFVEPDRLLLSKLAHGKSKRISSTIDEYVLEISDPYLKAHGINRSKLFQNVLIGVSTNKISFKSIMAIEG